MNKRGDKKGPLQPQVVNKDQGKRGEKEWGKGGGERGGGGGRCWPGNGGGPGGNRANVMSVINALSGRMCVCARGTNQQVPNLSLGPCVHYLIPLCTSLTALYFKHTGRSGGRGIIGAVTSYRLTKVIGTITSKDLRLTCFVKDLRGYGSDVCVWIKRHAWWHHES